MPEVVSVVEAAVVAPEAPTSPVEPDYRAMANRIAVSHGISTTTFSNLITSESNWNPTLTNNANGSNDRGIVQISGKWHPEVSDDCAYDTSCALEWAAKRIKDGYIYEWTVCSCTATVRLKVPDLPRGDADTFIPNVPMPWGQVMIFEYPNGQRHLAYKVRVTVDGIIGYEGNGSGAPCTIRERLFTWKELSRTLIGFYTTNPPSSASP